MKNQKLNLYALFILVLVTSPVCADSLLWRATTSTSTVYLFGSIHVANESMYPLPKKVETAYDNSTFLVVEVNQHEVDQLKLQQKLLSIGVYPGAETIEDHIDKITLDQLKSFLTKTNIPYPMIAKMRPGLIALTLTVARSVQLGFKPELGIDLHFLNKAKNKKRILQLETAEQQIDLLLGFSDQELLLKHTIVSLDELDSNINNLVAAWQSGNTKQLENLIIDEQIEKYPEFKKLLKRLFEDRNIAMTNKIAQYLTTNNTYFVVVGAGHLIGKQGVVSLLEKQGIKVTRM